jgi:hypothetical protein
MGIPQESGIINERWAGFNEAWKKAFEVVGAISEGMRRLLPVGLPSVCG